MELTGNLILFGSVLFLISVLSSALSPRLGIPVLLIFLVVGMLAGEDGLGGFHYDDVLSAHLLGSAALAVILFDGGLRTNIQSFRVALRPALVLATAGVVLTSAITGAFATWVLDLHWSEGLLVGAIVGSTDAAAVFSLLHAHGMALKDRVSATLEIESGMNDPMAIFLTILLVELLSTGGSLLSWHALGFFLTQMLLGGLLGAGAGYVLAWVMPRLSLNPGLYPLLVLFGALATFGLTTVLGGSGFLAVYVAGLLLSSRVVPGMYNIHRFFDGMAWLSQIAMFLILGLLVTPSDLVTYAGAALGVAAVLIFVARPIAVGLCLLPFRFSWREQLFISWVGLRGAVPIILALFPWIEGLELSPMFFNVAFFVVLVSLLLQGWTVAPTARWLDLEVPSRSGRLQRFELGVPGQEQFELVGYRLEDDSPVQRAPTGALQWPEGTRPLFAIRHGRVLFADDLGQLERSDQLYLLARHERLGALDRLIVGERDPERLGERRFFGDFVIRPDAGLTQLGLVYGFEVPPAAAGRTIAEHLEQRFPRPVVGDRLQIGHVEFVVREMRGDAISQVGLKLLPP